jgi:thiamine transporter ThiT
VDVAVVWNQEAWNHKLEGSVISYFVCFGGVGFACVARNRGRQEQVSNIYRSQLRGCLISVADRYYLILLK